jgi:hypothetical protein
MVQVARCAPWHGGIANLALVPCWLGMSAGSTYMLSVARPETAVVGVADGWAGQAKHKAAASMRAKPGKEHAHAADLRAQTRP